MKCYWELTDDRSTTRQIGTGLCSKMAYCSRNTTKKTGSVKHHQVLIPKKFVHEVQWYLQGEIAGHPGVTEIIIAYKEKSYYPNLAQLIRKSVMPWEQCINESRIYYRLTCLPLPNPSEHTTGPEYDMQSYLVQELSPWQSKHRYSHGYAFQKFSCLNYDESIC